MIGETEQNFWRTVADYRKKKGLPVLSELDKGGSVKDDFQLPDLETPNTNQQVVNSNIMVSDKRKGKGEKKAD
jgi:hypothetical protein